MAASLIAPIAEAIAEGFKLIKTKMDTEASRRAAKAIEAAEKYIQVNERSGQYTNINDAKRIRYLKHFSKRFFHYH